MSFLSYSFALFLFGTVAAYWLAPRRVRKPLLLLASLAFYASFHLPHALLIVAATLVVYALSRRVQPTRPGRVPFVLGILLCIGLLGTFKYARLLVDTVADLGGPRLPVPELRVPLGISFFTFEFIHYLVDVRLGRIVLPAAGNLLDFALFVLFFPTLLSGPIKRYQVFLEEGERARTFRIDYIAEGLTRMIVGLGKKLIVADSMTAFSSRLLTPDQVTRTGLWVAMYAYAIQIYFDFAGYSDLAIGAARLFGYRVPENFDHPYLRPNLSEFWRHWHMSLSSWIRDYLFIPLGGSRAHPARVVLNLTVVMALCGLWHGASWNFVVWGLWHGLGLGGLRLLRRLRERVGLPPTSSSTGWQVLATLLTFQYVSLGWVLFATPSMAAAVTAFSRMFLAG
ncbi:MAG: MBOAT family O-acyltransferase [Myxococcales bacterium]|nr:MBOAT family protein [Myxococcota bacterium]MDW8280995.1 MBOAT family O-acyltransferase [Myxococcales bacterium]